MAKDTPVNDVLITQNVDTVNVPNFNATQSAGNIMTDYYNAEAKNANLGGITTANDGRVNSSLVGGASTTPTILGGNMLNPNDTISPDFNPVKVEAEEKEAPGGYDGSKPQVADADKQNFDPLPNILNNYATYSYAISLYILKEEDANYHSWLENPLPNNQLIVQTGGISVEDRNPYFDVDFYIDQVEVDTMIGFNADTKVSNATGVRFKITEPYGFSFMDRWFAACDELTGNKNPVLQPLLLVIKFYGYETDGSMSKNDKGEVGPIVTKYVPIRMKNVKSKIEGSAAKYDIEAIAFVDAAKLDSAATIQVDTEIAATTVEEFLNNQVEKIEIQVAKQYENAPPFNQPKKTTILTKGLAKVLNDAEQALVTGDAPKKKIANEYVFVIDPEIAKATLAKPSDNTILTRTSMVDARSAKASDLLSANNMVRKTDRLYSIQGQINLFNLIASVIQTSSFITSQQCWVVDEKTKEVKKQTPPEQLQWFKISTKVELLGYDEVMHDQAKRFIYIIEPYNIPTTRSPGFETTEIKGVHKVYNYWFTGENTEVLHFEQNYNAMFLSTYASLSTNDKLDYATMLENVGAVQGVDDYRAATLMTSRTSENTQNTMPYAAQIAVDAATSLYNPSDLKETRLKIFGDPAWIHQGMLNPQGLGPRGPFTEDGSVNSTIMEAAVGLRYHISSDYDLTTGLQDWRAEANQTIGQSNIKNKTTFDLAFAAFKIKSLFEGGKFTQDLELKTLPKKAVPPELMTPEANKPAVKTEETEKVASLPPFDFKSASMASRSATNAAEAAKKSADAARTPAQKVADAQKELDKPSAAKVFRDAAADRASKSTNALAFDQPAAKNDDAVDAATSAKLRAAVAAIPR